MRIKDLQNGAGLVTAEFDKMMFVVDLALPDSTLRISGSDLRRGMGVGPHTHAMNEVGGLIDALSKKFDKSGGTIDGSLEVKQSIKAKNANINEATIGNATINDANVSNAKIIKAVIDEVKSRGYIEGEQGKGLCIETDANGVVSMTIDNLKVMKEAIFKLLTVEKTTAVGAKQISSYASAKIVKVESMTGVYRCYYDSQDIGQLWQVGDQALYEEFKADQSYQKYYWRLVVAVGRADDGMQYIDLSMSNALGSGEPMAGDEVIGLGHRGADHRRMGAVVINSWASAGPEINVYDNINSFVLPKPKITLGRDTVINARTINRVIENGDVVPMVTERGAWDKFKVPYYNYDRVSFGGRIYLCITDNPDGVISAPSTDNHNDWLVEVERGEDAYNVVILSSNGVSFINGIIGTELSALVYQGKDNVTNSIDASYFSWKRISEDPISDQVWNSLHEGVGSKIVIQEAEVCRKAMFEVEVIL